MLRLGLCVSLGFFCSSPANAQMDSNGAKLEQGQSLPEARTSSYRGPFTDMDIAQHLKGLGSSALRQGKYDEAAAHFGSALEFNGADIWSLWQRCWALTELRQMSAAHIDCQRAMEILSAETPQNADVADLVEDYVAVLSAYAKLLRIQGMSQKVVEEITKLHNHEVLGSKLQSSDRLNTYLAHAFADLGQDTEVLSLAESLLTSEELSDIEIDALLLLRANTYSRMARLPDAIADYSYLASKYPSNASYKYFLCSEQIASNLWRDAELSCANASQLEPERELYELGHAISVFRQKDYKRALPMFRNVEAARPDSNFVKSYILATEVLLGWITADTAYSSLGDNSSIFAELIRAASVE